ncbi:MAG: diacylglycerol/lipid kinase family protein [Chloroflexota bacterium]
MTDLTRVSPRRVRVILNPAAGQDKPVLGVLNRVLRECGVEWDAWLTRGEGDAQRLAERALAEGADVVAVYGGDGTVAEVAHVLVDTRVPLAILPGGTANVLAMDLGIPADLTAACALACGVGARARSLDVGALGARRFVIALSVGWAAHMVAGAHRANKEKLGLMAYVLSGILAVRDMRATTYQLTLDGAEVEINGVTCIVANVAGLGQPGVALAGGAVPDDGFLDVFVIRGPDPGALYDLASSILMGAPAGDGLARWQARNIRIATEPLQIVQIDGELLDAQPVEIRVLPGALRVIVPEA